MADRISTPWGLSDDAGNPVAEGITFYSTPSHGGYRVSEARRSEMHPALRAIGDESDFHGPGWFEEDCEWVALALTWPNLYPVEAREVAQEIAARYYPAALAALERDTAGA